MNDKNAKIRLQDGEEVLAYQFLNVVDGPHGEIRFGGNAFIRDGIPWSPGSTSSRPCPAGSAAPQSNDGATPR